MRGRSRVRVAGNLEQQLQRAAQPQIQGIADQIQQLLDRLGQQLSLIHI